MCARVNFDFVLRNSYLFLCVGYICSASRENFHFVERISPGGERISAGVERISRGVAREMNYFVLALACVCGKMLGYGKCFVKCARIAACVWRGSGGA